MSIFIDPSFKIETEISPGGISELMFLERMGRTAYKSEEKITEDGESAKKFIKMLIKKGHESPLEHSILTVRFICSRAISHELVRHRLCSFTQESQRYVNYSGKGVEFIRPGEVWNNDWIHSMNEDERLYKEIIRHGIPPQYAREVLPNSTKTEVVMTTNYREWRHILKLRTAKDAHPEMRRIMIPLLYELKIKLPIIFDDIEVENNGKYIWL